MNFMTLEMPLEPTERAEWLQKQIVAQNLDQLVAELSGMDQLIDSLGFSKQELVLLSSSNKSFDEWVLPKRDRLRIHGLLGLQEEEIAELIRTPHWLIELQQWAMSSGGPYWNRLFDSKFSPPSTLPSVAELMRRRNEADGSPKKTTQRNGTQKKTDSKPIWLRRDIVIGLAAAACLTVIVGRRLLVSQPGWGFQGSGLLTADLPEDQYLESLSEAAGDWFNKRPTDKSQLLDRLASFSAGCQTLIDADHPQLTDETRTWLVGPNGKCQQWKEAIDSLRDSLDSGELKFSVALAEADEIVERLGAVLAERAKRYRQIA